jgi:hypothetical protein
MEDGDSNIPIIEKEQINEKMSNLKSNELRQKIEHKKQLSEPPQSVSVSSTQTDN